MSSVFVTPVSSSGNYPVSTTLSSFTSDPTIPAYSDDLDWITAYLTIHSLSAPSYRYPFLLWIVVALVLLIFTLLHWIRLKGGFIGAYWSKWALRRRTWRKKHALEVARKSGQPHKQPFAFPSNAQIFTLAVLSIGVLLLCLDGPDYINPNISVWNFADSSNSTYVSASAKRDTSFDPSTLTSYRAQYTIQKSFWTSSARFGNISFALFPLCVLFALKSPPFAVFAIPFMVQLHFDKLALLHRWSGRIIWVITAFHVILWSVQLSKDIRQETGKNIWSYVWLYDKFVYGWVAFGLLTLVNIFSLPQFRTRFYDYFYLMHILLVPLTLVFSALHHPPVWWWLWAALSLWVGERLWRCTWWFYINGLGAPRNTHISSGSSIAPSSPERHERLLPSTPVKNVNRLLSPGSCQMSILRKNDEAEEQRMGLLDPKSMSFVTSSSPYSTIKGSTTPLLQMPLASLIQPTQYIPPAGYAHATLMPGRTICLRILTPGYTSWAPGQHFLICIPSVSMFSTHPFTCASICDEQCPTDAGRILVFIIRTKSGWTKRLWDMVEKLIFQNRRSHYFEVPHDGLELPNQGVVLRAYVDGPFGSSIRTRWSDYSSAIIVAGGSGISFAVSIVQFLCLCSLGRDSHSLGAHPGGWSGNKIQLNRIRLVWIVREFSHIQWCATLIRRCLELSSGDSLEVSIFVTNSKISTSPRLVSYADSFENTSYETVKLVPPARPFASERGGPLDSEIFDNDVDLSYYFGGDTDGQLGHEEHILDYTNFDGDDDTALPGERRLSRHLKKEGRIRRERSLKVSKVLKNKVEESISRSDRHIRQASDASTDNLLPYLHSPSNSISQTDDYRKSDRHTRHSSVLSTDRLLPKIQSPPLLDDQDNTRRRHHEIMENSPAVTPGASSSRITDKRPVGQVFDNEHNVSLSQASRPQTATSHYDSIILEGGSDYGQESFNRFAQDIEFELNPRELGDVRVISEVARPGRPRLDRIFTDELERAKGSIIVAFCGPNSLNALMRKIVAANIDPRRLLRGDKRGSVMLISEEFEY